MDIELFEDNPEQFADLRHSRRIGLGEARKIVRAFDQDCERCEREGRPRPRMSMFIMRLKNLLIK